jgi:hypothetical protein
VELDGFVIEAVAGRGGMGVVYRARQQRPDRIVALKVIAFELAQDPKFRARFRRESAIAAQIEHPNVIPVHAVGEAGGILYIAMRFVAGIDLRSLLANEGRLAPRRAAAIADQVAQALDAAHAHGLVHRDVKPANILIAPGAGREHVYLSDFGLSRHIEGSHGLTGTGAFLGTIDYVAPEQARGDRVDARTDVYSLGCVLFQALTGTVPYPMDNDLAKLYAHDSKPPPSALERLPDLPAALDPVLARAMAKAPEDRYQSAGDLGRAALAAAAGRAAEAPAPALAPTLSPGANRVASRPRRRVSLRLVALGAVVIAAAIVALIVGGGGGSPGGAGNGPKLRVVAVRATTSPGGYHYRLVLSAAGQAGSASPARRVPYYFTLSVARGNRPATRVQQLKLPFAFTSSSVIAEFTVDPEPRGIANVGLSWYVRRGDANDVTHYFTLSTRGVQIDS